MLAGATPSAYDEALLAMYHDPPDIRKAFQLLTEAENSGDARATYALATWYLFGQAPVVERDRAKAARMLEVAAAAGIPDALHDVAVSYEKGDLYAQDLVRAFQSYLAAALRGDQQSVYEVGRCYFYGIGVSEDQIVGDIWLKRAAELNIVE